MFRMMISTLALMFFVSLAQGQTLEERRILAEYTYANKLEIITSGPGGWVTAKEEAQVKQELSATRQSDFLYQESIVGANNLSNAAKGVATNRDNQALGYAVSATDVIEENQDFIDAIAVAESELENVRYLLDLNTEQGLWEAELALLSTPLGDAMVIINNAYDDSILAWNMAKVKWSQAAADWLQGLTYL